MQFTKIYFILYQAIGNFKIYKPMYMRPIKKQNSVEKIQESEN